MCSKAGPQRASTSSTSTLRSTPRPTTTCSTARAAGCFAGRGTPEHDRWSHTRPRDNASGEQRRGIRNQRHRAAHAAPRVAKTRLRGPADPFGLGSATLIALFGQPHRPFSHAIQLKVSHDTRTDVAEATPEAGRAGRQPYYASAATVSGDSSSSESLSSSGTTPARNR